MDMVTYGDDYNARVKFDPRTKLLVFLTGGFVSLNCYNPFALSLYGAFLAFLLILSGKVTYAIKNFLIFVFIIYFRYCIQNHVTGTDTIGAFILGITTIIVFCYPIMMSFYLVMNTTRISHFLASLSNMHLPSAVIIPTAVFFRFIPTVMEEWTGIRKAMAFRGISLDIFSIIKSPFKTIEYVLIPLLFSSMSVMEELASAAIARGLDSEGRRTSFEEAKLRMQDYLVMIFAMGFVAYVFWETKLKA